METTTIDAVLAPPPATAPLLAELYAALASARAAFHDIGYDSTNTYYNSRYASLHAMQSATVPALADNGLSVTQFEISEPPSPYVTIKTLLTHASGASIVTVRHTPIHPKKDPSDPHARAAAETFGRRYAYAALLNISGAEDDDGNAAVPSPPPATREAKPKSKPGEAYAAKSGAKPAAGEKQHNSDLDINVRDREAVEITGALMACEDADELKKIWLRANAWNKQYGASPGAAKSFAEMMELKNAAKKLAESKK